MTEETKKIIDEKIEKISKYQKGDKFVVEIKKSGYPYSAVSESRNCSEEFLDSLDRLDSTYINEHFGALQDEAYNQGLNDAWELAKQILYGVDKQLIEIFDVNVEPVFFDLTHKREIINNHTPQEVKAMTDEWRESQNIKRGDVVKCIYKEMHSYGVYLGEDETDYWIIYPSYDVPQSISKEKYKLKKTGKHLDIQSILSQIGGE